MIDNVATITVADTPIKAQVVKTDLEGNLLANGTFTLAPAAGSSFADAYPARAIAIESDANGVAQIPAVALIAGNTYELAETVSPAGYEVLGTLTFIVNADGTLALVDPVSAGYTLSVDNGVVTITAADTPVEAQLVKHDENGEPLAGATFTIVPNEGSAFAGKYSSAKAIAIESGAGGVAPIPSTSLIVGNTYTISETVAPSGYEFAGSVAFTVNADGTLSIVDASGDEPTPGNAGSGTYQVVAEGGMVSIVITDAPIELDLGKVSTSNRPLAGAVFRITGTFADGTTEQTVTVDRDGRIDLPRMVAGESYTIVELKAPAGFYRIFGEFTFTVNADGTIEAQDSAMAGHFGWITPGYAVGEDGLMLVAVDRPIPPANPDDPDEPEDPDEPTDPDEPEHPEDPDEPGDPDDPTDPTDPEEPADPDDPAKPADPAKPTQPADKDKLPQSGDASWPVAYVAASGAVPVIAGVALETWRRRSKLEH